MFEATYDLDRLMFYIIGKKWSSKFWQYQVNDDGDAVVLHARQADGGKQLVDDFRLLLDGCVFEPSDSWKGRHDREDGYRGKGKYLSI